MKASISMTIEKSEVDAYRDFAKNVVAEFIPKGNPADFDELQFTQEAKIKLTGGNVLAFFGLRDQYDVEIDVEINDSYLVEYMEIVTKLLPTLKTLFEGYVALGKLSANTFHVEDLEIVDPYKSDD